MTIRIYLPDGLRGDVSLRTLPPWISSRGTRPRRWRRRWSSPWAGRSAALGRFGCPLQPLVTRRNVGWRDREGACAPCSKMPTDVVATAIMFGPIARSRALLCPPAPQPQPRTPGTDRPDPAACCIPTRSSFPLGYSVISAREVLSCAVPRARAVLACPPRHYRRG
eukprot:COSAG02_NODE_13991_length_1323_cov_1.459150_1_plen_166_part_00